MISQTGVFLEDLFQLTGDNCALIVVPPFAVKGDLVFLSSTQPGSFLIWWSKMIHAVKSV